MRRRVVWALVVLAVLAGGAVAVGRLGPSGRPPAAAVAAAGEPTTYTALGGCETFGAGASDPFRTSYARRLFAGLDRPASFVNYAVPGATVANALVLDAARAVELDPRLVTVWLGATDLVTGTPLADFERDLGRLLDTLAGPDRTVLVATLPEFDEVPGALVELAGTGAWEACDTDRLSLPSDEQRAAVEQWNAVIVDVAEAAGAVVVDVHDLVATARADGAVDPLAGDGFYPSDAGHEAVAAAFADAFAAADDP